MKMNPIEPEYGPYCHLTVKEAFEKAFGPIPEGATCHYGYSTTSVYPGPYGVPARKCLPVIKHDEKIFFWSFDLEKWRDLQEIDFFASVDRILMDVSNLPARFLVEYEIFSHPHREAFNEVVRNNTGVLVDLTPVAYDNMRRDIESAKDALEKMADMIGCGISDETKMEGSVTSFVNEIMEFFGKV
jgi:hypothetical protein